MSIQKTFKYEIQKAHTSSINVKNIPLDSLSSSLWRLEKDKPIITICSSGGRSKKAKKLLKNKGFSKVYSGGSWSDFK